MAPDDTLTAPAPEDVSLAPSLTGEATPAEAGLVPRPETPTTGDKGFNALLQNLAAEDAQDLADPDMSIQTYIERLYKREDREYDALMEYKENDENLSPEQREIMNNRLQTLDYNRETRALQEQYMANPNDPDIAERYHERQAELKEFRELMQNSEEFRDNDHMQRMRELEEDLEQADGMEAQNAVKIRMAEEMREFKRDLLSQGEEGLNKMISFTERNSDNTVIRESGMLDTINIVKKQRAAHRAQEASEELENGDVTPGGAPEAGATQSESEEATLTAEAEISRRADRGDGSIDPVRLEGGQEVGDAVAQTVPDARSPEERGTGAQLA